MRGSTRRTLQATATAASIALSTAGAAAQQKGRDPGTAQQSPQHQTQAQPFRKPSSTSGQGGSKTDKSSGEWSNKLLGDWAGIRPYLEKHGVSIDLSYVAEPAWVIAGGKSLGGTYTGEENLKLVFHGDKLIGVPGVSLHLDFVARHGENLSAKRVGDTLFHAQEIYGDDPVAGRLVFAYLQGQAFDKRLTLKGGRLPVETDFGTLPHGCYWMVLGICADRGLSTNLAWTVFPFASWGGSVAWNLKDFAKNVTLKTGVYEANPQVGGHYGYDWTIQGATGIMMPFEVDWTPKLGADDLPGTYKLGGYVDMGDYAQWYDAVDGLPQPLTPAQARKSNRTGVYALAEQTIWQNKSDPATSLSLMGGYAWNSPKTALFQSFAFAGVIGKGLVPGRPDDMAGFSVDYGRVSHHLTDVQQLQTNLGSPLARGALAPETDEVVLEANYKFQVVPGFTMMPDLQYVIRPNGTNVYPNALIAGVDVKIDF